jgi:hypothetical protein
MPKCGSSFATQNKNFKQKLQPKGRLINPNDKEAAMVPVHLPTGAAILCCGKLAASELHCLTAAPRLAIHEALATPHKYLGTSYELGLSSKMDDACIAYQLFLEVPRFLLVFSQALLC